MNNNLSKIEKISQLEKAIADADIRLKSIQANIEKIDAEINALTPRKNELDKNIKFHKKKDSVPLAHEYKRSKAELSKITARLIFINAERGKAGEACKDIEKIIEKFKKDHADLVKTNENNILRPSFGSKNGKK